MTSSPCKLDLFAISWPIFVETALMTLIGALGLWMAGHVSAAAVAIFGLSNELRALLDRLFRVVGIGASVVVTQHRGAGDTEGARAVARAGFAASVWTGLAALLIVGIWPRLLLEVLYLPPELMQLAIPFIAVVGAARLTSLPWAPRATGDARWPVKISVVVNVVLGTGLAWLLGVHFAFGLPGLWIGYLADDCVRGVAMWLRWYYLGWTTQARAARRRILSKRRSGELARGLNQGLT